MLAFTYDWHCKFCADYAENAKTRANFFGNPKTHPCKNRKDGAPSAFL